MPVERRGWVIAFEIGSTGNGRNPIFNGRRQPSCGGTSRMTRECQVRICERLGGKFPGPTRPSRPQVSAAQCPELAEADGGDRSAPPCRSPATKKGRCRLHGGASGSGGPSGERNGQYTRGEWTKGAIAERRR